MYDELGANWRRLVDVVFADDFVSKLGRHYEAVVYSFCRLWSRMVKAYSRRRSEVTDDSCSSGVVDSATTVLLHRLKAGTQLRALCRGKCLGVLMETVNPDPGRASPVPPWRTAVAESVLNVLYFGCFDDNRSSDMSSSLFNCCLFGGNRHPMTCGGSAFFAADNHACGTVGAAGVRTSELSTKANPRSVAMTTSAGTCENTPVVRNRRLTTSSGLRSGHKAHLTSCRPTNGQLLEEFNDRREDVALYDAKLVRKFVLLVLRCLDIITREPADQCMPHLLFSLLFVCYLLFCLLLFTYYCYWLCDAWTS